MKRNDGLDFLKFICSFMVICIHKGFPEPINKIFIPIARMAVPIFFVITGYFYSNTKETSKDKQQIRKMGSLSLGANFLYLLYSIVKAVVNTKDIQKYIVGLFNLKVWINFILFNDSPFNGHLWYLGAILYVLLIIYFYGKKRDIKRLYPIIPILLLTDLILGKYSLLLIGREFSYIYVRNFLFVGLPYFLIGHALFVTKPEIEKKDCLQYTLVFAGTTILERLSLGMMGINATRDHYLSTTFLAIFAFLFALKSNNAVHNGIYKNCCWIGNKLAIYIYILHPILINFLEKVQAIMIHNDVINTILAYLKPFLVFSMSIIVSMILYLLKIMFKRFTNNIKN